MSQVLTNTFSSLSRNDFANKLAKKYGLKFGASRFVAGDNIADAVKHVKALNNNGMAAMLNYLGEFVTSEEEANLATENCIKTLDAIDKYGLDCNLTVKSTSLGLDLDNEVALSNLKKILDVAKKHGNFVRLEMEDYNSCQTTLDNFKELRSEYDNIGTVLQSYLYRTKKDIDDLNAYNANLRLVKGAYNEPPDVAFPDKAEVDASYEEMIKTHLLNGNYAGVATHDPKIIRKVIEFTKENNISNDQFEFQMLYGIRPELQKKLAKNRYKMRVYVPYGIDWFGYFMRRLAERPENVSFVLKNTFKK